MDSSAATSDWTAKWHNSSFTSLTDSSTDSDVDFNHAYATIDTGNAFTFSYGGTKFHYDDLSIAIEYTYDGAAPDSSGWYVTFTPGSFDLSITADDIDETNSGATITYTPFTLYMEGSTAYDSGNALDAMFHNAAINNDSSYLTDLDASGNTFMENLSLS